MPRLRHHHRCVAVFLSSTIILLGLYFQNFQVIFAYNSYRRGALEGGGCACRACLPERNRSVWYDERHEPSVHLLLNGSNRVLRADVSGWWQGLQDVPFPGNYTEVSERLFSLFPDEERYADAGPNRCRTCAVVGNSGNLLGSHYGSLIDSNDFVMRINKGPTEGFETDVGFKTTHRMIYPESATDLNDSAHLVFFPFKVLDMQWLLSAFTTKNITKTYITVPSTLTANKDKVMILHPEFIKYVHENWTERHGRYPSSGFLTLIFALHICDEVNVFGFGATNEGNWHHYFDETLTYYANENHAGDYEYKTITRLHEEQKILMYRGWT